MGIKCHLSALCPTQKLVVVHTQRKKENVRDMYWWTASDRTRKTSKRGNVFHICMLAIPVVFPDWLSRVTINLHFSERLETPQVFLRFRDLRTWSTTQLMQTQEAPQARGQRENKCVVRKSSKMGTYITVAKW